MGQPTFLKKPILQCDGEQKLPGSSQSNTFGSQYIIAFKAARLAFACCQCLVKIFLFESVFVAVQRFIDNRKLAHS
jgi:hypothetical protein